MLFSKHIALSLLFALGAAAGECLNKDNFVRPDDPKLSEVEQCWYMDYKGRGYRWNVIVNDASDFTDEVCGSGFVDNLHGSGLTVTGFKCNYAHDEKTMNANFITQLTPTPEQDVSRAIQAAFGGKKVICADWWLFT